MRYLVLAMIVITWASSIFATTCVIAGCNNELCVPATDQTVFSTCLWKAEYQCYSSFGVCEADSKGQCRWRPTTELNACLKQAKEEVDNADRYSD